MHSDKAVAAADVTSWLGFVDGALVRDEVSKFSLFNIPLLLGLLLSPTVAPVSFLLCSPDT